MFDYSEIKYFTIGLILGVLGGAMLGLAVAAANTPLDKFCPECGARYHVTAEYCTNDGYELREVKN
jgi:hypothetical protein